MYRYVFEPSSGRDSSCFCCCGRNSKMAGKPKWLLIIDINSSKRFSSIRFFLHERIHLFCFFLFFWRVLGFRHFFSVLFGYLIFPVSFIPGRKIITSSTMPNRVLVAFTTIRTETLLLISLIKNLFSLYECLYNVGKYFIY